MKKLQLSVLSFAMLTLVWLARRIPPDLQDVLITNQSRLLATPVAYSLFDDAGAWLRRVVRRERAPQGASPSQDGTDE